jgi:hypothetical protein
VVLARGLGIHDTVLQNLGNRRNRIKRTKTKTKTKRDISWLTGNNKRRRTRISNKERELLSPQNV